LLTTPPAAQRLSSTSGLHWTPRPAFQSYAAYTRGLQLANALFLSGERAPAFVLLDIGANPDSTPENLYQYAHMGALFAERVLSVRKPRVALLSIGEEKGKGDARIQRATELLDASGLRFEGIYFLSAIAGLSAAITTATTSVMNARNNVLQLSRFI
jgi:hypothetical protein